MLRRSLISLPRALSALLAFLLAISALGQEPVTGRCVGVTDGDTIKVLNAENQLIRVRIAFIDSPERRQAFGSRAKQAMSELVFRREVKLHTHGFDRYGRTLAQVFVDGQDAGLEMIRQGLAWCYDRYLPEADADIQTGYRQAQEEARIERLGLWSDPSPIAPWEWRKAEKALGSASE